MFSILLTEMALGLKVNPGSLYLEIDAYVQIV